MSSLDRTSFTLLLVEDEILSKLCVLCRLNSCDQQEKSVMKGNKKDEVPRKEGTKKDVVLRKEGNKQIRD